MKTKYTSQSFPLDLGDLGHIEGISITETESSDVLCHYFGGVPYALPPTQFRAPQPLPSKYQYGTKEDPAQFKKGAGVCPQPGFLGPPDKSRWTEDCLQLNIWIPTGKKPAEGWPVFFFIHGGWLQFGSPNFAKMEALAPLLSETPFQAIVVTPAYRVNAFGFLTSKELEEEAKSNGETVGNYGFWDQRTALEWTSNHIGRFGGDKNQITCGGYSAGAHSTFQHLAYDMFLPKESSIIKRAIIWSNGAGVQPRDVQSHQKQFDELLTALDIPLSLDSTEKLDRLRKIPADKLVEVQGGLEHHEFRAVSEGVFVSKTLIQSINDGTFAKQIKERGIKILNGETRDEHYVYRAWRTPKDSYDAVLTRLAADYPEDAAQALMDLRCPDKKLPSWAENWPDVFGRLYADMQVHDLERGFVDKMAQHGLIIGKDLLRYRIEWRAKCADSLVPPEWKVTHATDRAIWFWGFGLGDGLTAGEKVQLARINECFADFVKGKDLEWSKTGPKWVYRLNENAEMDMWEDDRWEQGLEGWKTVNPE